MGPDGQQQSVMALVWVNARFRLHLRSPGAACRRPSGIIRPSAPLPSVAARAVRRQTRNKLFGSTRALPASVMCLESLHVCTLLGCGLVTGAIRGTSRPQVTGGVVPSQPWAPQCSTCSSGRKSGKKRCRVALLGKVAVQCSCHGWWLPSLLLHETPTAEVRLKVAQSPERQLALFHDGTGVTCTFCTYCT